MNTVAVNGTKEYEKEVVSRKDSLTERFLRYFGENARTIAMGMLLMNGNASIYNMYRYGNLMREKQHLTF